MTLRLVLAVVLAASACAHADRAALVTSTATLACDWGYTHRAASDGWRTGYEANPVLGPTPDPGIVAMYFSAVLVANVVAWHATPAKYRSAVPLAITARQSATIYANSQTMTLSDARFCGF